jgi:hypothetical protein
MVLLPNGAINVLLVISLQSSTHQRDNKKTQQLLFIVPHLSLFFIHTGEPWSATGGCVASAAVKSIQHARDNALHKCKTP